MTTIVSKEMFDNDLDTEEWMFGDKEVTVNYELKIAKFQEKIRNWKAGRAVHSKIFSVGQSRFQFNVYPSGRSENVRGHVSVYLHNLNAWDVMVTYSFTAGTETHAREKSVIRRNYGIGKHDFLGHNNSYILLNSKLLLNAKITLLKEQVVVNDQDKVASCISLKQCMRKELTTLEMQLKEMKQALEAKMSRLHGQSSSPSCPVCLACLAPPAAITQCKGGHLACQQCSSRLRICPACEGGWDGRAVGLEGFLREIQSVNGGKNGHVT
jgi:hypothetical protein